MGQARLGDAGRPCAELVAGWSHYWEPGHREIGSDGSDAFYSYIKKKAKSSVCLQPSRPCPRPLFFTMPSLRRFPSSPTVRHAPYSSASARVRRCRRSAPSETSGRRVLADIAWWTVTDGQRGPNVADTDSVPFDENSIGGGLPIHAGVQHPLNLVQLPWVSAASEEAPEVLPAESPWKLALTRFTQCRPLYPLRGLQPLQSFQVSPTGGTLLSIPAQDYPTTCLRMSPRALNCLVTMLTFPFHLFPPPQTS